MSFASASKDAAMLILEPAAGVMDRAAFAAADDFISAINSAMAVWTSKGCRSHIPSYERYYCIFRNFCQYRN
jgi:hypothetical protein